MITFTGVLSKIAISVSDLLKMYINCDNVNILNVNKNNPKYKLPEPLFSLSKNNNKIDSIIPKPLNNSIVDF
jgi:hypothetical protein